MSKEELLCTIKSKAKEMKLKTLSCVLGILRGIFSTLFKQPNNERNN